MDSRVIETDSSKTVISDNYKYYFNKENGMFIRWGKTANDDPSFSTLGPELLDIEITRGKCLANCSFCYKCNGSSQPVENMTFEQFKTILNKIPNILTQIAFGITDIYANPDFFKMMEYARYKGIIPNYTAHGLDFDDYAIKKTVELCGVVCISVVNKEKTFEAIRRLYKAGMDQINIHYVLSEETYENAFELIREIAENDIIKKINALVFLDYKPKGNDPNTMHHLSSVDKYAKLTKELRFHGITYGFDSCAAPLFLKSIRNKRAEEIAMKYAEPCESGIFSSYINVKGDFYPCSFSEGEGNWKEGVSVLNCNNFLDDIWFNERINNWRTVLLNSSKNCDCKFSSMCRNCPVFEEINICKSAKVSEVA